MKHNIRIMHETQNFLTKNAYHRRHFGILVSSLPSLSADSLGNLLFQSVWPSGIGFGSSDSLERTLGSQKMPKSERNRQTE